jgi:hypothetical protein
MDLKSVNLYVKHIGDLGIQHFGLDDIFHKVFSTDETSSKYYYPIFYRMPHVTGAPVIPQEVIKDIKNRICLVLVVHPKEGFVWSSYDIFIEELANLYSLSYENFVALNCNPVPSVKYNSVFYNYWEFASFGDNIIKEQNLGRGYIFKDSHRPYKFISLNRICHPHRWATLTALYPYKDQGLLSFANKDYPGYTPHDRLFIAFKNSYTTFSKKFNDLNLPENFKLTLPQYYEDPNDESLPTPVIIDSYADKFYHSYLHIVCETFIGHPFFSEKTYKPIKYFQPFVMINGQYSLQYLRALGYQTFSGYIDESYDLESNNERRIELAIQAGLNFINRKDLHEVMKEMYPIFEHNHNVFIERCRNFQDQLHGDISKILNAQDNNANQN